MKTPVQLPLGVTINDCFTFENYFASANQLALKVLQDAVSLSEFSCIFIWGDPGVGKTHLLQAACQSRAEQGGKIAYIPLEIAGSDSADILSGMEAMDLVCVDDLDQIAGLPAWEERLFVLFNRLRDAGKCLVVSAAQPPANICLQLEDLVSRLAWHQVIQLKELDDTGKLHVLALRCQLRGIELPNETANYLLKHYDRNMAILYRFLDELVSQAITEQRRLTIPFIKTVSEQSRIL